MVQPEEVERGSALATLKHLLTQIESFAADVEKGNDPGLSILLPEAVDTEGLGDPGIYFESRARIEEALRDGIAAIRALRMMGRWRGDE